MMMTSLYHELYVIQLVMALIHCRHFTGYKPCSHSVDCNLNCKSYDPIYEQILIIHLGALGAVLRGTSHLKALKRKHPNSFITWITEAPANKLLENNPFIDRVLTLTNKDLLTLQAIEYDCVYSVDKSFVASGILNSCKYKKVLGFGVDKSSGSIIPLNPSSIYLWELGLSNQKKFFENKKTESQLVHESLELGLFHRDPYILELSDLEKAEAEKRRIIWKEKNTILIGINTGCSPHLPYKKMSIKLHRELIIKLNQLGFKVVLLGGPEDKERNYEISKDLNVILSPTDLGIRDGIISVEACDIVVSGDSLGMHMGIALKKWIVAWFGSTCSHEIDLYGRGCVVHSDVTCGPCWKRSCFESKMCYDHVPVDLLINGVLQGVQWIKSSYKQPFLETSSFQSL